MVRNDTGKLCHRTQSRKNFDLVRGDIPAVYSQFANRKTSFLIAIAYRKNDYSRRLSGMIAAMPDILADYREWADEHLQQHVSTHSDRCHMWHEWCMIHRLAAEIERLREAIRRLAEQDAMLSLLCKRDGSQVVTVTMDATLTDAERGAMESALDFCERTDRPLPTSGQIATLRGLLERLGGGA